MGIVVKKPGVSPEEAAALGKLCPFGAIEYENGRLSVNAACKACKICVKKGPAGVIAFEEESAPKVDKSRWKGIAVFAQMTKKGLHPVVPELLGKARELAAVIGEPVMAVVIGCGTDAAVQQLLSYGAQQVYVYDDPAFAEITISPYTNAFYDFVTRIRPGSVMVGATNLGRSLAPRVAARCHAGLTADCTVLEMRENTDLVQIRPAFGGNIMAQILTPNVRPQFCTVRYKIFSAPERLVSPEGTVHRMEVSEDMKRSGTEVLSKKEKPALIDISEAEVIVACGRGFRSQADLAMAQELADALGGQLASTRPLVEAGWMDPRRQIGLSGRTVKPRLIITLGVSGSVQFAAGMNGSDRIIAVNSDENASIFNIAHVGLVGDLYEIVPRLLAQIREGKSND